MALKQERNANAQDQQPARATTEVEFKWGRCEAEGCPMPSSVHRNGGPQLCVFHTGVAAKNWDFITYKLRRMEPIIRLMWAWDNAHDEDDEEFIGLQFNKYVEIFNAEERQLNVDYYRKKGERQKGKYSHYTDFVPCYIQPVETKREHGNWPLRNPSYAIQRAFNQMIVDKEAQDSRLGLVPETKTTAGCTSKVLQMINDLNMKFKLDQHKAQLVKTPRFNGNFDIFDEKPI